VDGEIGPTKLDLQMLDWLRHEGIPHTVVATKQDKVRSPLRPRRKKELAEACDLEIGDVIGASVQTGAGIEQLRELIRVWIAP
jgi:GTP-binding protein